MKYITIFLLAAMMSFTACSDDGGGQHTEDINLIKSYLAENSLTAEETSSGLHYIITRQGDDQHPSANASVSVLYKGYFMDGAIFDQRVGTPITFGLNQVIQGWQEGIPKIDRGGKGTLLIPSRLGYGGNPPPGIPANAVLLFDVDLVDF